MLGNNCSEEVRWSNSVPQRYSVADLVLSAQKGSTKKEEERRKVVLQGSLRHYHHLNTISCLAGPQSPEVNKIEEKVLSSVRKAEWIMSIPSVVS